MREEQPYDHPGQYGQDARHGDTRPPHGRPEPGSDDLTATWPERGSPPHPQADVEEQTIELREEELLVHKELLDVGEAVIRTVTEEVPGRMEVDAYREELQVEHVPVGQVVTERQEPWEEDDTLVVPVYEEQLVVVKRLVLREQLRIRRVGVTERQLFEDTLRRDRLVVEDPDGTGMVHEIFPDGEHDGSDTAEEGHGLLDRVKRAIR